MEGRHYYDERTLDRIILAADVIDRSLERAKEYEKLHEKQKPLISEEDKQQLRHSPPNSLLAGIKYAFQHDHIDAYNILVKEFGDSCLVNDIIKVPRSELWYIPAIKRKHFYFINAVLEEYREKL